MGKGAIRGRPTEAVYNNGYFAIIGIDITSVAIAKLSPTGVNDLPLIFGA
jgi:hypothetical protein